MKSDESLVEAYKELVDKLDAYAVAFNLPPEDAADALQDSYIRLFTRQEKSETSHRTSLLISLKNNLIDRIRRNKRYSSRSIDSIGEESFDSWPMESDARLLNEDLMNSIKVLISPVQFKILCMRSLDGLEFFDIAQNLGMTESAVRTNLCRARKTIKEKLTL